MFAFAVDEQKAVSTKKCWKKVANFVKAVTNSIVYQIIVLILSLWALFMVDCRFVFFPAESDHYYDRISEAIFVFFALELGVNLIFESGYIFTFFFFVDITALVSLTSDTPFIWNFVKELADDRSISN